MALAIAALCAVLAVVRPEYFGRGNLVDLFLANLPVLIIAAGMTLVMLAGEIDISVGSAFAVCAVIGRRSREGRRADAAGVRSRVRDGLGGRGVERRPGRVSPAAVDRRLPRDDDCAARRAALGHAGGVGSGPAGRFSVDGVITGRLSVRRRHSCGGVDGGDGLGSPAYRGGPAPVRHGIQPRRRASCRRQHRPRQAGRVCLPGCLDGTRSDPECHALQPDSRECRHRSRNEGHCRGRRRRYGHYRWARHARTARCSVSCSWVRSDRR